MTLTRAEIDQILEELELPGSHVQQVFQPRVDTLIFDLYRKGERCRLMVSLTQGAARLHATNRSFAKPKRPQRFDALLRARLRGSHIVGADHVEQERIVALRLARAGEEYTLWLRLWGGAANAILTDPDGTIIDACYRRPKRGEVSGGSYSPEHDIGGRRKAGSQPSRVRDYTEPTLNEALDRSDYEAELEEERERLRKRIDTVLAREERRLARTITGLERREHQLANADASQHFGELLLANLHAVPRRAERVQLPDWEREGSTVEIPLDPSKSPQENAEAFFARAKKDRSGAHAVTEQLRNLRNQLEEAREVRAELSQIRDLPRLRELRDRYAASKTQRKESDDTGRPGLTFRSNGFEILVGRNARENDELLRRHVRGNDTWIHARDCPGGYVFIRHRPGKSIPLEVLLDAGNLAIHYSKARGSGAADLYYTQVKYLNRPKGGKAGLVVPTQEKNLRVDVDSGRLERLLAGAGNGP